MALELKDLTADERIALVGLIELVAAANARVTDDEAEQVRAVIVSVGEDVYRTAVEEADRLFPDSVALRAFLPQITRQEAREIIYEAVLEAAMADAIDSAEAELLDWLASEWNVNTEIDDPETDSCSGAD